MLKNTSHIPLVLMLGVLSQIGQVLLLREFMMVFQGNELSIGLILASWMVWVGVGSFAGAALVKPRKRTLQLAALTTGALLLSLPATILLIRRLRGLFSILPGAYVNLSTMAISSLLIMAPTCLLLGAQFVFLAKIWREREDSLDTIGAEKTYIGEAAGNMVGGILFTFLLVHHLQPLQMAVLATSFMLAAILFLASGMEKSRRIPSHLHYALLLLLLLSIIGLPLLGPLDRFGYEMKWRYLTPDHQLMEVHQSKYGTITIVKRDDQYSFFQSGHLLFSTAGPKTKIPALEEEEAGRLAHLSMVQHTNPATILLIGGGLRGTLTEIARYPVERIDYIELDEVLSTVARPYLSRETLETLEDPRVHLLHTDGRLFVKESRESYDMIIIDIPDPSTALLNRYYTKEFFEECEALLNPGGVLVTGALSTPNLRGLAVANRNATIFHTLSSVFETVIPAGEGFLFFFSSNDPGQVSVDVATLQERFLRAEIETPAFSLHHYSTHLQDTQIRRVYWILNNHGRSPDAHLRGPEVGPLFLGTLEEQMEEKNERPPVGDFFINTDTRPIAYYYTLMFWDALTGTVDRASSSLLLRVEFFWSLPLFFIPLILVVLFRRIDRPREGTYHTRFAVLFTTFSTGLSTMVLQVALLFAFQSIYGFVYEIVGLVIAIFMSGLALGAFLSHRFILFKGRIQTLALVQLLMAVLASLMGLLLPRIASIPFPNLIFLLFSLMTLLAGLINGIDFPLACACFMKQRQGAEKTTGIIYGVELFGACMGAVISSILLIPILGIRSCFFLASLACLTASLVLLLTRESIP